MKQRNDQWLCQDPTDVPHVMQTKFPATVSVLSINSNKGDIMTPHFFERGIRVNAKEYVNVLYDVMKPWIDRVAKGRPCPPTRLCTRVVRKNRFLESATYNRWKSGLIPLEHHMQNFRPIGKAPIWALLH